MHKGFVVWLTGLSGSGKTTVGCLLEGKLRSIGARVEMLDGDIVRTRLCRDLGFSRADRNENIRRIGFVCELLARNNVIVIVAAISPYREVREEIRALIDEFVEIYMRCRMEVLLDRDTKGLYKRALAGEIQHFTGISDPYEPPLAPEVVIDSSSERPEESLQKIWASLSVRRLVT